MSELVLSLEKSLTKDCNEEKMIGLLDKFLTNSNPIRLLLQTIDRNSEKNFDDMINCGLYSVVAQKTIDSSDIRSIYAPVYHISDFKTTEDEHVSYELSSNEYWLNYDLIKEALVKANRTDLIGNGPNCLIRERHSKY